MADDATGRTVVVMSATSAPAPRENASAFTRSFRELGKGDTSIAGGKGANLGELVGAGFPVPPGFVITADAYLVAMDQGGVRARLRDVARDARPDDPAALARASEELRTIVERAGHPEALRAAILADYHALGDERARRGALVRDERGHRGDLVRGHERDLHERPRRRRAGRERDRAAGRAVFGQRVISYRASQGLLDEPAIAVVVQRMVDSERSGVMFTADPSTSDRSRVVIEAAFGLGEVVVSGQVEPDTYVVAKDGPRVLEARIGVKTHKLVRGPGGDQRVELSPEEGGARVLGDAEVLDLARIAIAVEKHYGTPQDMEWAIEGGASYLVQSRPITTLHDEVSSDGGAPVGTELLSGLGASPGLASGAVRDPRSAADGRRSKTARCSSRR